MHSPGVRLEEEEDTSKTKGPEETVVPHVLPVLLDTLLALGRGLFS